MIEMICIICPRGCHLKIDDNNNVSGNFCPRGSKYAISEITFPTRTLTSTVKIISEKENRLPVKSSSPLPKDKLFKAMELINKIEVRTPIKIGDIIINNIMDLNIDIVATKNIEK